MGLYDDMEQVLLSQQQIREKVEELGAQISQDYAGKEPVLVSVISGNVMQTLHQIDGATAETELRSLFTGGCGKMEQWPLRVAFGGPYLRVRGLKAQ